MLKVAVVGCGLVSVKKHIPSFLRLKNKVKITAVCDLDIKAAKKVSEKFGISGAYSDFYDMLEKEKPDIIDICTPPGTHAELSIKAMESGAHIILEKPMALNVADCDIMLASSLKYNKKIYVMHNQIFNPAFSKGREMVLQGEIGDILGTQAFLSTPFDYMSSKKDHWAHKLPGGVLGETGPHAVYLTAAFIKNIHDVNICASKHLYNYTWSNFDDFRINMISDKGIGSISLIYASDQWAADFYIIGTKGIIKIDLQSRSVFKYKRICLNIFEIGLASLKLSFEAFNLLLSNSFKRVLGWTLDAHAIGIENFVDNIIRDTPVLVSAEDGKETVRIMGMIVEKLKNFKQ